MGNASDHCVRCTRLSVANTSSARGIALASIATLSREAVRLATPRLDSAARGSTRKSDTACVAHATRRSRIRSPGTVLDGARGASQQAIELFDLSALPLPYPDVLDGRRVYARILAHVPTADRDGTGDLSIRRSIAGHLQWSCLLRASSEKTALPAVVHDQLSTYACQSSTLRTAPFPPNLPERWFSLWRRDAK